MENVPPDQQGYPGYQTPWSDKSDYNYQRFLAEQVLSRISTATLVKIVKVTTNGQVAAIGQVDVQPLVQLQDGQGNQFQHGKVYSLPYFRLQGGADKAIIMDPKAGDVGIAIFADRDISGVKRSKGKQAPAGSFRRFAMSDGLFLGCFLAEAPTCYIRFTDDKKIIASPDNGTTTLTVDKDLVTIKSVEVKVQGDLHVTGAVIAGWETGDQVGLQTHTHGGGPPPDPGS